MCGIAGSLDLRHEGRADRRLLCDMLRTLVHRGPDDTGMFVGEDLGCGTARLAIVDRAGGRQPLFSEDESIVLVFNGEIFNHADLRQRLVDAGHRPRTGSDAEVLIHLYEEHRSTAFLEQLDGQFAFVLYDRRERRLLAARDPFGICPLYYATVDGQLLFGSEIKALLRHPSLSRQVDLRALDQVFSLPGIVSPRTILEDVRSLPPGHWLRAEQGDVRVGRYWDLTFPVDQGGSECGSEADLLARLRTLLEASVGKRLLGEAPIGVYLSGGLDSSLIAALLRAVQPEAELHAFSMAVEANGFSERPHQALVADVLGLQHHTIEFRPHEIGDRLRQVVYHCECPIKELHNAGALALSAFARSSGIKVILSGQGADELFAGYIGYRFDASRRAEPPIDGAERRIRRTLWDDESFFYEKDQHAFLPQKRRLYSARLNDALGDLGCLAEPVIAPGRLSDLHPLHKRSYVDCRIRLGEHLLADHGDRMCLANGLEMRHPFLDRDVVDFVVRLPADLKLRRFEEKYALKRLAQRWLPATIIGREKFGFAVPGTPALIREGRPEITGLLSPECLAAQGYFDPDEVRTVIARYATPGFAVNVPFEDDLLAPIITFGLLHDLFNLPAL